MFMFSKLYVCFVCSLEHETSDRNFLLFYRKQSLKSRGIIYLFFLKRRKHQMIESVSQLMTINNESLSWNAERDTSIFFII